MKMEIQEVPKQIEELSKKVRIMWLGVVSREGDPWQNIIGKIKIGKRVNVEEILEEKGFEDAS